MYDPNKTQLGAPPAADPNRTQLGSPVMDPNKTMMGAPTYEATTTIKPVQCPVCKTFNPVGVMFCVECGLIFDKALDGDAFGAPAVQLPVLVGNGKEYQIRPGTTVIGRQGDIMIEDTRVSRKHAQAYYDGSKVEIEDLGSTNGTSIGGSKLAQGEKKTISSGDTVSFGGFEMTLGMPGEANKTMAAVSGKTSAMAAAPTTGDVVAYLEFDGNKIPLKKGTHTFGRRDSNPIVIPDPYVSGTHGEFEVTDTGVYLTDTGSTNGTVVNDAKLAVGQKTEIGRDDVIRLGQLEIRVVYP